MPRADTHQIITATRRLAHARTHGLVPAGPPPTQEPTMPKPDTELNQASALTEWLEQAGANATLCIDTTGHAFIRARLRAPGSPTTAIHPPLSHADVWRWETTDRAYAARPAHGLDQIAQRILDSLHDEQANT